MALLFLLAWHLVPLNRSPLFPVFMGVVSDIQTQHSKHASGITVCMQCLCKTFKDIGKVSFKISPDEIVVQVNIDSDIVAKSFVF